VLSLSNIARPLQASYGNLVIVRFWNCTELMHLTINVIS